MPKSKTFKATDEDFETYDESRVRGANLLFEKQFNNFHIQRLRRRSGNAKFYLQFRLHNFFKTIYGFLR